MRNNQLTVGHVCDSETLERVVSVLCGLFQLFILRYSILRTRGNRGRIVGIVKLNLVVRILVSCSNRFYKPSDVFLLSILQNQSLESWIFSNFSVLTPIVSVPVQRSKSLGDFSISLCRSIMSPIEFYQNSIIYQMRKLSIILSSCIK